MYPGGLSLFEVRQGAPSGVVGFQFFDPATSTIPVTECALRTTSTLCSLSPVVLGSSTTIATYDWRVEYAYGGAKVRTQVGASPSFAFAESCGVSPPEGAVIPITVRLIATDTLGNSTTFVSGQAGQPALKLRTFNCQ